METVTTKQVGANIKRIRIERRYTIVHIATCTDIDPSQISNYENGNRMPTIQNLVKIAIALNCGLSTLIIGDEYDPGIDTRGIDDEGKYILSRMADRLRK